MFGSNAKTPFGTGAFGTTSSSLFGAKTQTTSAFGTPSFGSTTPAFGGGTTTSGLFGSSNAGGSLFSQPTTQQSTGFSFGQQKTGGLFGSGTQSTSFFQTPQTTSAFGTPSVGAGSTSTGLFGSSFGSTATSQIGGGLFGGTSAFGSTAPNGTTVKFNPVTSSENVNKNGTSMAVQTKYQCITSMKEYESKSLEELRLEDYTAGRKSGTRSSLFSTNTQQPQQTSFFGSSTNTGFGQNKTFGGFGQPATTSSSLFGQTSQSGGLFGSKPVGTGSIFGATTTTPSTGFGFGTSGGLFGQTSTSGTPFGSTSQSSGGTGLFGTGSAFGTTQTTSTGGLFGTGTSTFGQTQTGGLFGATSKPFGFGTTSSGTNTFGSNTFGTGSTGLFGSTATSKPAFSFNTAGTTGFGSTLGGFGTSTSLGSGGLFGTNTGTTTGGGLFGGQQKTGFGTGLGTTTGFGGTGLGGTTLGGGTGIGGFGTSAGLNANQAVTGLSGINQASFAAFQQQQVLQQQLKALANSPFGDSPLFRNLTASRKRDEDLAVPGPASKSTTAASHYKVFSKPTIKVRVKPSPFSSSTKAKLFDGIIDEHDQDDASLTPKRSIKKLVIKQNTKGYLNGSIENSPLRLRSSVEDDDENLIARIPAVPTASVESQSENMTASNSIIESPMLQQAKKKPVTKENEVVDEVDGADGADDDRDQSSDSADDNENITGIVLERPEYYTIPSIQELNKMVNEDGRCLVKDFIIGREDYGEVKFLGMTDVKDLNLDEIVFFRRREAEVYPDNYPNKPEVGKELNKRSEISLHKVWPNDKTSHTPIKSPERLKKSGFIERLEEKTSAMGALFLDYKPDKGTWVFQVEHFTRYGLKEQLFEEDKQDILKKLKMAAERKAEALKNEMESAKEKAMLIEEKARKEEAAQAENVESKTPDREDDLMENDDMYTSSMVHGDEYPMRQEGDDAFTASVQTAKISGVDPQRLQGMKALLFEDDDAADFLSPREKTLLANRSLVTGSMRQTKLMDRFDSTWQMTKPRDSMNTSLFSETALAQESPSKSIKRTRLLKSTFMAEKKEKSTDASNISLFSTRTSNFQKDLQPRIVTAKRKSTLVAHRASSLASREDQLSDAGLSNGRRSRVGWAPNLHLSHFRDTFGSEEEAVKKDLHERTVIYDLESRFAPSSLRSGFSVDIENVCIGDEKDDHSHIVECLKNTLKHSRITAEDGGAPFIETVDGVDALHEFAEITQKFRDNHDHIDAKSIRYQHAVVWDLVKALWGRLENTGQENLTTYQNQIYRRHAVSKWLSKIVENEIKTEIGHSKSKDSGHLDAIFSLLSGRKIREACEIACQNREYRLSLLLSQASGDLQIKHLLQKQLDDWKTSMADKFMNIKRLKIYQLLSGLMVWMSAHGDINLCENLDWRRSFALHLWFYCPSTSSVAKALKEYKNSYKGTDSYSAYAAPPKPCYAKNKCEIDDSEDSEAESQPKDICYHLLKLFSKRSHSLEKLLCPNTHTSDPLDYQLCWQLQQILQSLGYTHLSEAYECLIQASFASQLETYGLWEWAVFVLLHIKDDKRREFAVKEVLSRQCQALENCDEFSEKETLLINSMKVPKKWIFDAKAQHARYCLKPYDEAVYLLKGEQWNNAHQIVLKELASDVIIDGDYGFLRNFLLELSLPERTCTIRNWKQGGQVYLDYILLREKLLKIEKGDLVTSAYNLEDLRGDITSLINMITTLKADSSKERLAQAEMGKTASNLLKIVHSELAEQGLRENDDEEIEGTEAVVDKKYTWSFCQVAPHVAMLPLPPDYIQQELEEIVCNAEENMQC